MSVSFLILAHKGADWLRHTLPRTKRAFPTAQVVVVTTSDDQQTIALASAFRTVLVTIDPSIVTANGSKFNYSALVRAGQAKLLEMKAEWVVATRANVVVDESIAAINVSSLNKTAIYGCFFTAFDKPVDLLRYVGQGPSSADVRNFVPRSEFMMFHVSSGNRFGMWSPDTKTGEDEFSSKFSLQYMIQTKLAHLGTLARDSDVRTSPPWVSVDKAPHIAPVHPGALENRAAAPPPKRDDPIGRVVAPVSSSLHSRFGAIQSKIQSLPVGRRELDTQQVLGRGAAKDVVPLPAPSAKHKHFKPLESLK